MLGASRAALMASGGASRPVHRTNGSASPTERTVGASDGVRRARCGVRRRWMVTGLRSREGLAGPVIHAAWRQWLVSHRLPTAFDFGYTARPPAAPGPRNRSADVWSGRSDHRGVGAGGTLDPTPWCATGTTLTAGTRVGTAVGSYTWDRS
jgi:hypothetical protein